MAKLSKKQMKSMEMQVALKELLTIGFGSLEQTCARVEQMAKDKERTAEQQLIYDYNINFVVALNSILHPAWNVATDLLPNVHEFLPYCKAQRQMAIDKKIIPSNCDCTYCSLEKKC